VVFVDLLSAYYVNSLFYLCFFIFIGHTLSRPALSVSGLIDIVAFIVMYFVETLVVWLS